MHELDKIVFKSLMQTNFSVAGQTFSNTTWKKYDLKNR